MTITATAVQVYRYYIGTRYTWSETDQCPWLLTQSLSLHGMLACLPPQCCYKMFKLWNVAVKGNMEITDSVSSLTTSEAGTNSVGERS